MLNQLQNMRAFHCFVTSTRTLFWRRNRTQPKMGPSMCGLALALVLCANASVADTLGTPASINSNGTNTGAIPDNDPAGRNINFNVSGFSGQITDVQLDLTIDHTWVGDITATLISANGLARMVVIGRPGLQAGTLSGSSANLSGTYVFSDANSASLWLALPNSSSANVPASGYRASSLGITGTLHGGCANSFRGVFGGLSTNEVNGLWSLSVTDSAGSDTGSVTAATLRLFFAPLPDAIFKDGLENLSPPVLTPPSASGAQRYPGCVPAPFDLTGSGRTSFALVRAVGTNVQWFVKNNDGSATGGVVNNFIFGKTTDFFLSGDVDGDGISDPGIWNAGKFNVIRSSRPTAQPLEVLLGAANGNPSLADDFDGDGRADFAVYRDGATAGSPSTTEIVYSGGGRAALSTGEMGALPVGGSDVNNDGRAEIWIQSSGAASVGRFRAYDAISGTLVSEFTAGNSSDFVTFGQYVGGAAEDLMFMRTISSAQNWFSRDGDTGVIAAPIIFGVSGNSRVAADFDGDGIRDVGNWAAGVFNWRKSSDLTTATLTFGTAGDYPIANSDIH
jgi:subtilisin-like proprotein convertase family protein